MVHQGFGLEAQIGQVLEQEALLRRGFVKRLVTGLTAARSQEPDCRRPAVGGGGVETIEYDVHSLEQSVVTQFDRVQIVPGQRADVDEQHVEGRGLLTAQRELRLARGLGAEEVLQPGIQCHIVLSRWYFVARC